MLDRPERLAALAYWTATTLAFIAGIVVVLNYFGSPKMVFVSGDVEFASKKIEIYLSVRNPTLRPIVNLRDPLVPSIKVPLVSIDDFFTMSGKNPLSMLRFKAYIVGDSVIIDYYKGRELVAKKVIKVVGDSVYVDVYNISSITFSARRITSFNITRHLILMRVSDPLSGVNATVNIVSNCNLGEYNIKGNQFFITSVTVYLKSNRCKFQIFATNVEYPTKLPSPFLAYLFNVVIPGLIFVLYPILLPAILVLLWFKWLRHKLGEFKGAIVYHLAMALLGVFAAQHWDAFMTFKFAFMSPVKAYLWTYENMLKTVEMLPSHVPDFPAFTYLNPVLLYLLYPLRLFFHTKPIFLYSTVCCAQLLGMWDFITFRVNTYFVYLVISLYIFLFNLFSLLLIKKFFGAKEALVVAYSPFFILISYFWKMFEPLLLPFFILSLVLYKRRPFIAGLLLSIPATKVYPLIAVIPMALNLGRRAILLFLGLLAGFLPAIYTAFKIGLDKYLFVTLIYHTTREMGWLNYFPPISGTPIDLRWLSTLGTAVILLLIPLFISKVKNIIKAYVVLSIIYLMFNRIVSPQNYLFTVILIHIMGLTEGLYISFLLSLYTLLVFPTFFYFVYHYTPYLGVTYFSLPSIFSTPLLWLTNFIMNYLRPLSWPVLIAFLFAFDFLVIYHTLRSERTFKYLKNVSESY